jgi:hypothetical protein
MDATTGRSPGSNFIAQGQQTSILELSNELLLKIGLRLRDARSMCSFAQVCTDFAAVSRIPVFVKAKDKAIRASLWDLPIKDRPARIYQLACAMAPTMELWQWKWMMDCLDGMQEEKPASEEFPRDAGDSKVPGTGHTFNTNPHIPYAAANIGAAISSGRITAFSEEVKRHAWQLMKKVTWHEGVLDSWTLAPTEVETKAKAQLKSDALLGIWKSISTGTIPSITKEKSAFWLLRLAGPIPMKMKLPLLEAIMNAPCIEQPSSEIGEGLHFMADTPGTLDAPLAEEFFGIICAAWSGYEECWPRLLMHTSRLVKLLPPVPWRENSPSALFWFKALVASPYVRGLFWQDIEKGMPNGIFTSAEFAYLRQAKEDGNLSWEAFMEAFPEKSGNELH